MKKKYIFSTPGFKGKIISYYQLKIRMKRGSHLINWQKQHKNYTFIIMVCNINFEENTFKLSTISWNLRLSRQKVYPMTTKLVELDSDWNSENMKNS